MQSPADRLKQARGRLYGTATEAARAHGWKVSTYLAHENGQNRLHEDSAKRYGRAFRVAWTWLLDGEGPDEETAAPDRDESHVVPVMGYIGAGAEIEPEFEQVPPDGLDQIELPFAVPEEMIAFQVRGDSMLPKYSDGDAVVVPREQGRSTDSLIGDEAAVRTFDGKRWLKRIMRGSKRGAYNLESTNARTILDARIAWASEIWAIVPAGRLRRIPAAAKSAPARRSARASRAAG